MRYFTWKLELATNILWMLEGSNQGLENTDEHSFDDRLLYRWKIIVEGIGLAYRSKY